MDEICGTINQKVGGAVYTFYHQGRLQLNQHFFLARRSSALFNWIIFIFFFNWFCLFCRRKCMCILNNTLRWAADDDSTSSMPLESFLWRRPKTLRSNNRLWPFLCRLSNRLGLFSCWRHKTLNCNVYVVNKFLIIQFLYIYVKKSQNSFVHLIENMVPLWERMPSCLEIDVHNLWGLGI